MRELRSIAASRNICPPDRVNPEPAQLLARCLRISWCALSSPGTQWQQVSGNARAEHGLREPGLVVMAVCTNSRHCSVLSGTKRGSFSNGFLQCGIGFDPLACRKARFWILALQIFNTFFHLFEYACSCPERSGGKFPEMREQAADRICLIGCLRLLACDPWLAQLAGCGFSIWGLYCARVFAVCSNHPEMVWRFFRDGTSGRRISQACFGGIGCILEIRCTFVVMSEAPPPREGSMPPVNAGSAGCIGTSGLLQAFFLRIVFRNAGAVLFRYAEPRISRALWSS